jgi:hypothetical protein
MVMEISFESGEKISTTTQCLYITDYQWIGVNCKDTGFVMRDENHAQKFGFRIGAVLRPMFDRFG